MSKLLSIYFDNKYKSRAYFKAAMALDSFGNYVEELYSKKNLKSLPGIGASIEKQIEEINETKKLQALIDLENSISLINYDLLFMQGISDKLLKKVIAANIKSIDELKQSSENKSLLSAGFSNKEVSSIFQSIHQYQKITGKFLLPYALCLGQEIINYMAILPYVKNAEFTGECRLFSEKVANIDILCEIEGEEKELFQYITKNQRLTDFAYEDRVISCKTTFGINVNIIFSPRNEFYAYLLQTTGPNSFSDTLLQNDNQIKKNSVYDNEKDIFYDLGLSYILPEQRSLIETDQTSPTNVVELNQIKGDLHLHSNWSDGLHTIEDIVEHAPDMHYEYIAITDHSKTLRIANGLSPTDAISQVRKIHEINMYSKIKILAGIEVEILSDGTLDYSDEVLQEFDFVIAAIHSHMQQSRFELMGRLQKALSNKYVNILAHPTGRLLGKPGVLFSERNSMDIDFDQLLSICKEENVVLEINCFPERFDINKENAAKAISNGIKLSIGTDSHSIAHMNCMKYGVMLARGAGAKKENIINTYSYSELLSFFRKQRGLKNTKIPSNKPLIKDFGHYFSNNPQIINGNLTVVGIDLTGSQNKPSGWAYLERDTAITQKICSDEELIEMTMKYNPNIVSIDSPLSIPEGRCCTDANCTCADHGINRYCERLLRHFRIGVYPCLIPSMVNLTTRGMNLAQKFRSLGLEVIESYPGVAQDVLGIPRKGKGLEHLVKGLSNFGIKGDLLEKPNISHDEVDAITSALVGYFYLNDQYIGMGNEKEDYLIVPRIQSDLIPKRVVIGLCGEIAAGKTTLAEYLKFKYGFRTKRYSEILKRMLGENPSREELQRLGLEISNDPPRQRELSKIIISEMEQDKSYVIDGLRQLEDFEEMKNYFKEDFILIFIEANYKTRLKRYRINNSSVTDEGFFIINHHKVERRIPMLSAKADHVLKNNSGYNILFRQIEEILKRNK